MPAPFDILGIDHVVLRATDPVALERFYVDVLGCTVEKRQEAIALTQLRAGSALIDIVPASQAGPAAGEQAGRGANLDHLCLRIAPFDAAAVPTPQDPERPHPATPPTRRSRGRGAARPGGARAAGGGGRGGGPGWRTGGRGGGGATARGPARRARRGAGGPGRAHPWLICARVSPPHRTARYAST